MYVYILLLLLLILLLLIIINVYYQLLLLVLSLLLQVLLLLRVLLLLLLLLLIIIYYYYYYYYYYSYIYILNMFKSVPNKCCTKKHLFKLWQLRSKLHQSAHSPTASAGLWKLRKRQLVTTHKQ